MREPDCEYYARRREECLARAEAASDATVACVHREFAAAYENRLLEQALDSSGISVWN